MRAALLLPQMKDEGQSVRLWQRLPCSGMRPPDRWIEIAKTSYLVLSYTASTKIRCIFALSAQWEFDRNANKNAQLEAVNEPVDKQLVIGKRFRLAY